MKAQTSFSKSDLWQGNATVHMAVQMLTEEDYFAIRNALCYIRNVCPELAGPEESSLLRTLDQHAEHANRFCRLWITEKLASDLAEELEFYCSVAGLNKDVLRLQRLFRNDALALARGRVDPDSYRRHGLQLYRYEEEL